MEIKSSSVYPNFNNENRVIKYFEMYTDNQRKYICNKYKSKRILTYKVWENLESNNITFISGIRRIGKSVLLTQICDELIVSGKRAIIIDAQLMLSVFVDSIDYYTLFTLIKDSGYNYVLFDEICKIPDASYFGNAIRNFSNSINFILTGSSKVGVEKVFNSSGRGVIYTITDWTYLEKLLLNKATSLHSCPYRFNQLSDLTNLVSKGSVEEFLYYSNSDELIQYIKSCIEDTLESNIRRHFTVIDDLEIREIKAMLELISYSQILELDSSLKSITSRKYFNKLYSYIIHSIQGTVLEDVDVKQTVDKALSDTSPFEYNINNILSTIGKKRVSSILRFLIACGLVDVQIKYGDNRASLYELIEECKFNQLSIVTKHRSLTINIFKRALEIVLGELKLPVHYPNNIELMTDDRLNLKGDLLESYIYSTLSDLLPDENVTKFRDELQREIDLLICRYIRFGLEIKNRKTLNNSKSYIKGQLNLKNELGLKSFAMTTIDCTQVYENVKFINVGELIAYLDSLILETNYDTIVNKLFTTSSI